MLPGATPVLDWLNKAQQMRWGRATVRPFPDIRTAVLNNTLEDAFGGAVRTSAPHKASRP